MNTFDDVVAQTLPPYPGAQTRRTPNALLPTHGSLIRTIREGYDDTIYEYGNDIAVGAFMERVLTDDVFRPYPQLASFREEAIRLDEEFSALLSPESVRPGRGGGRDVFPCASCVDGRRDAREVRLRRRIGRLTTRRRRPRSRDVSAQCNPQ